MQPFCHPDSTSRTCRLARSLLCLVGLILASAAAGAETASATVKNVILMVADGGGFGVRDSTSMYQGRWDAGAGRSAQVYDGPGWVKYACSTYPLNLSTAPTDSGVQDKNLVYDSVKAWDRGNEKPYAWLMATYTDSAAAATALSTGSKTYNNAINWSDRKQPLQPTMSEAAKSAGKSAGVVTSVQWSHATPAGLSNAHNVDRDNYVEIATAMLSGEVMDVVMGCGNPDYDNNGAAVTKAKEFKYVGGPETWNAIEAARASADGTYQGFRPVSTKAEFEALTSGPTPRRVVGTAQVATTLQQARQAPKTKDPDVDTPPNANVPSLATMVRGALNVMDDNPKGLFLLVEGGAVDWAAHNNNARRVIQEQSEFVAAIEAVVAWVETHSNWDETLLVLTADHETGLLWGPDSDKVPFEPLVDQGPQRIPKMRFNSKNHTNSLVPVCAKGARGQLLSRLVIGDDPVRGPYVDNTGVAQLLLNAVADKPLDTSAPR
jgi:alkaline phosphatase